MFYERRSISSYEMAARFSEGKMAGTSVAPDRCARADGDVAGCVDLRSPFAMEYYRQRHGPAFFLRNRFRTGRLTPGNTDRFGRLDRNQERKTGVENWLVSYHFESCRRLVVCDQPRLARANVSPGHKGCRRAIAALGSRHCTSDRLGLLGWHDGLSIRHQRRADVEKEMAQNCRGWRRKSSAGIGNADAKRFSRRQTVAASGASDVGPFSDRPLYPQLVTRSGQSRFSVCAKPRARFVLRHACGNYHRAVRRRARLRRLHRYPQRSSRQTHRDGAYDFEPSRRRALRNQFGRSLIYARRFQNTLVAVGSVAGRRRTSLRFRLLGRPARL